MRCGTTSKDESYPEKQHITTKQILKFILNFVEFDSVAGLSSKHEKNTLGLKRSKEVCKKFEFEKKFGVKIKQGGWQRWCKHILTNAPTSHRCVKIVSICIRSVAA